jgi:hypothetical protein
MEKFSELFSLAKFSPYGWKILQSWKKVRLKSE